MAARTDRPRLDVRAILADPVQRRRLMVPALIAAQAREGIVTTQAQAEAAYDKVQAEAVCPRCSGRMPYPRHHRCL